jgi:hypothetical protein
MTMRNSFIKKLILTVAISIGGTSLAYWLVDTGVWFLDPEQGTPAKMALVLVFVATPVGYVWDYDLQAKDSSE